MYFDDNTSKLTNKSLQREIEEAVEEIDVKIFKNEISVIQKVLSMLNNSEAAKMFPSDNLLRLKEKTTDLLQQTLLKLEIHELRNDKCQLHKANLRKCEEDAKVN